MIDQNLFPRGLASVALLVSAAMFSAVAEAEVREIAGAPGPAVFEKRVARPDAVPVRAFERLTSAEIHRLGPLAPEESSELRGDSNLESSSEKTRVGIVRSLASPVVLGGAMSSARRGTVLDAGGGRLEASSDGRLVWTTGFVSDGAGGMRLHLENVMFPSGSMAFVYSRGGETHGPYALGGEAPFEFWTNTVFADELFLEVQLPAGAVDPGMVNVSIGSVGHLEHESFAPPVSAVSASTESLASCFKDLNCVTSNGFVEMELVSKAVAHISYREGSGIFVCSGALLNTTAGSSIPYFLTANHCVSRPEVAATVEAYWDYRTTSCGGSAALRSGLPRTLGASLLTTGAKQAGKADFTLLRLNEQPPAGRYYLGWSAKKDSVVAGSTLHRVSHPDGGAQSYSSHVVSAIPSPGACPDLPVSAFIYSKNADGATKGGSSGAPLVLGDGLKVVGQLFGRCGRNLEDACDIAENSAVDGAFATYFEDVRQWLVPATFQRCSPSAVNLCLTGGRFRVEVVARDLRTGRGTTGTAIQQNDVFGYFSLPELTGQSENPEVFVKIVDGSALNGKHWVFYGGLTDLEFTLKVTDMETGIAKTYAKNAGGYCGDSDTSAF
jgi:hypothetical protein